ncbi:hypothetical protein EZ242_07160 [Ramlibacter rhizophilus]|uniref:Membrane transporter protein n=1 Tax=Ramlibacter rhizophilus TaxID=1781167 RepID=A0A4Z0BQP7_9BURK|nr:hypothetical protein EZ242_07160 [Ramlibacter rhizophilus]
MLLKLALVAASMLAASAASRRFGHAVGGVIGGMPMIAAPICAVLLVDAGSETVRAIALGTLVCIPGSVLHSVTVAWAARIAPWPVAVGSGLSVFLLAGLALTSLQLPVALTCALALAAPALGVLASPRAARVGGPVPVPHREIVLRLVAAVGMAAVIILGADVLPPVASGLLLAVPITGTILPCFTLPRHGAQATAMLMGGFLMGLHGFAGFFVVLYLALGRQGPVVAFVLALAGAAAVALLVQWVRRLVVPRAAAQARE